MKIKKLEVSTMLVNAYFYYDEETKHAVLIDPGGDASLLMKFIEDNELNLTAILLTHGHFDHIGAVEEVRAKTSAPLCIHELDGDLVLDPNKNLSKPFGLNPPISLMPDKLLKNGEIIAVGNGKLKVIHTPGHTPGGACFYDEENKILFTGDTLFRASIGRSDFPGSNHQSLINSIKKELLALPDDVLCYPGHNSETSIKYEKNNNPYVIG